MPLSANRRSAPQRGAESMGGLRLTCTWGHLQQTYNTQSLKHTHANVLCLGKTFTRNRLSLLGTRNAFSRRMGLSPNTFDRGAIGFPRPYTVKKCAKDARCGGRLQAQRWLLKRGVDPILVRLCLSAAFR